MLQIVTLDQYFKDVYEPRKLLGASCSCKTKYKRHLRWLSEHLGRPAIVTDLTEENIAALMQQRLEKGRAPGTVNSLRDQLIALANFAAIRGHIDGAPFVAPLVEYERTPTAWNREELRRLFASCQQQQGYIAGVPASDWWLGIHAVIWDSGARIGPVLALSPNQIDEHRRTLTLSAETQKQKADQAFVLHPDTIIALRAINYRSRDTIFSWEMDNVTLYNHYRKILRRAGLPTTSRDLFYKLRRTVASWFEAAGGDATKLLGHSSRKVTLRYLDPQICGTKQASELLFRPT